MTRYFVTASGTEIGKTHVAASLIRAARARGLSVAALKPVVSGIDEADPAGSDPARLLEALGRPLDRVGLDAIAPWRFAAPLSPDRAAAREGRRIDLDAVIDFCRAGLAGPEDFGLVEGVGGVMVPLDEGRTVLDWIVALRVPALLVTGSYLGSISHSLTAAACLRAAGVTVGAVIVSESPDQPMPLAETVAVLARHQPAPVIALPRRAEALPSPELDGLLP